MICAGLGLLVCLIAFVDGTFAGFVCCLLLFLLFSFIILLCTYDCMTF